MAHHKDTPESFWDRIKAIYGKDHLPDSITCLPCKGTGKQGNGRCPRCGGKGKLKLAKH